MSKITEKFIKDFKATKAKIKELAPANGMRMKKELVANLEKTWSAEDVMKEGVIKARTSGVTGKKAADFVKHAAVAKHHKVWQASLKGHHDGLDKFTKFSNEAKALENELAKRVTEVEKDLKKSGGMSDMKAAATVKEAKRALQELKKSASLVGSLQGHVVMYGMNMQRTVDAIVRQAVESVTPKEFPDTLNEKNRKRTEKKLKDIDRKIGSLCDMGMEAAEAGDLKKAAMLDKKAQKLFKDLEKYAKDATAASKMKKELKQAKDGKLVQVLIKKAVDTHQKCDDRIEELQDKIEELERGS